MILYESSEKFGWTIAIGRKDTGVFGFHVDYYDAPIYMLNLFVVSISYWGYAHMWFDMFCVLCGRDVWWRDD
jgi:hypothetical protein